MEFRGLLLEEVWQEWAIVRRLLLNGLKASSAYLDFSPEDILQYIREKDMQAWGVFEENALIALIVTRIAVYPKRKVIEIFLASGTDLFSWIGKAYTTLAAFGKFEGCEGMRTYGRKGWEKALKAYAPTSKSFVVEIGI